MRILEKQRSTIINLARFLGAVAIAAFFLAASSEALAQGWSGYARDPQHSCQAVGSSQAPVKVRWSTPVDLNPNFQNGELFIHYGSPVITRVNTVLVPVKTANGFYRVDARRGSDGTVLWSSPASDYTLPSHNWVPVFGITLTPKDRYVVYPGAGGTIYVRSFPDTTLGTTTQYAFFNGSNPVGNGSITDHYSANPSGFNNAIQICTPISSDSLGNLYFGFTSNGTAPGMSGVTGGLARISNTGVGSFVPASLMSTDTTMTKPAYNCAPAFSADGSLVYIAINRGTGAGYLCALNSSTLAKTWSVLLIDPSNNANALVQDDGSATPTVGPDGDVYYGILSGNGSGNHYRGFLLHYDYKFDSIQQKFVVRTKLPSAFGWDDTASIVPISAVKNYVGPSKYLLLTKFNNYGEGGGDGINKLALVDPNVSSTDPISGATVMSPFQTIAGVTPDPNFPNLPGAVREWCINSAAIDVVNKCAVVNSEDGRLYRWDLFNNMLITNPGQTAPGLALAQATGEAYTPTVIGPDGAVYAINRAVLNCCSAN